jgi:serine/threonine protein kinase
MHSWLHSPGKRRAYHIIWGAALKHLTYFFFIMQRMLYIVMPYCEGGDLDAVINTTKRNKMTLPEDKILRWSAQVEPSACQFPPLPPQYRLHWIAISTGWTYKCRLHWRFTSCMKTVSSIEIWSRGTLW